MDYTKKHKSSRKNDRMLSIVIGVSKYTVTSKTKLVVFCYYSCIGTAFHNSSTVFRVAVSFTAVIKPMEKYAYEPVEKWHTDNV